MGAGRRTLPGMVLHLKFVMSGKRHVDLPDSPAEVALVGRSNVGKSSLVNVLANQRQLAKVSNTPGRTQSLNLFVLPTGATVMDLPGYGYAAAPGREKRAWGPMIEQYLLEREPLLMVYVLVDGEIGPTKLDLQMLDWLRSNDLPHQIVATKLDKVRPSKLDGRKQQLAKACMLDPADVLWVSATKRTGVDRLQASIAAMLAP
jgi:GTP-binding protein